MNHKLLRLPDVKSITGLSKSTIYARIAEGTFPKQVPLGPRLVVWVESDIHNWIDTQISAVRGWRRGNSYLNYKTHWALTHRLVVGISLNTMPNYVYNSLTITDVTHEQWRDLAATFEDRRDDNQKGFLNSFYPEPDYGIHPIARTYHEIQPKHLNSSEGQEQVHKNQPMIREDARLSWRVQHWGTKWDVNPCSKNWEEIQPSNVFSSEFHSAWSPPSEECMAVISTKFPGSLLINYYQEETDDFCGVTVAKDGIARNFTDSVDKYYEPFIHQKFPDLDKQMKQMGLFIDFDLEFVDNNSDFGEFQDFIRAALSPDIAKLVEEIQ